MIEYDFEQTLPSGTAISVEADITPLIPGKIDCLPEDAYPSEGGFAEITKITIEGKEIDLDDLYVKIANERYEHYPDYLADIAYENWLDENS